MLLNLLLTSGALVAAGLLIWLVIRVRVASLTERLSAAHSEVEQVRIAHESSLLENRDLRAQLQEESIQRRSAETMFALTEAEAKSLKAELSASQQQIVNLSTGLTEAETKRQAERIGMEEKLQLLSGARQELSNEFRNLANEILEDKSRRFTEQNKINLDSLLKPLGEQINQFKNRVEETYEKESQQRVSLREAIDSLRSLNQKMNDDAVNLTNALKGQSKILGNWGEFVLEETLEKAGLVKDRQYSVRETLTAEDGRRSQPDVIVELPENRHLVIDSKVNMSAYLRYCSSENDAVCEAEIKNHIAALRVHIKELDLKCYQDHYKLNSLDFVLMFIPLEPAFIVAVRRDPTLFDDAFARRIVIVCPSTLLATMRTVRNIWRQEDQKRHVLEIATQAGALYDKFVGFVADLEDIGLKLKQTQNSYDAAHNKLTSGKGNLISRAERVLNLGAKASKKLPLSLVGTALGNYEIEPIEPMLSLPDPSGLEEGGLFPDLVAGEPDENGEEELPPLLKTQSVSTGET